MMSSGSPSRWICASLSNDNSDDSTLQSAIPQEKMLFSKKELLPCTSTLLLLLLLLLLMEFPASQYWTPLILLTLVTEGLSGGGLLAGLKPIEVGSTELDKDGKTEDIVLELNSEFIGKGREVWLNQRTGFGFTDNPVVAI